MLIYDVPERDRVFDIVTNNLRNLGIKSRIKKNSRKVENAEKHGDNCRKIFNVSLSQQPLDKVQLSSGAIVHVPAFIKQAITLLDKHINQEGLFRKAGSQARLRELVNRIDNGKEFGEKYQGIDVANCLKKYFRDLPEPIIPYAYHDLFVRCGMLKISKVEAILLACLLLPAIHLNTLAVFMDFLKKVSLHENLNKMNVDNLAKVIGPNIMPLRETTMSAVQNRLEAHLTIVKILIDNAKNIGVLPTNIRDIIQNNLHHCTEMESDRNSEDYFKEKKKKHRSGSLTRMFNGLKKIVGKNGSPETNTAIAGRQSRALPSEVNNISPSKMPKKRKVNEASMPPASMKKKRNSLDAASTITLSSLPSSSHSLISQDPDPMNKSPATEKTRMKKYVSHNIQIDNNAKVDKSKILGLNLDRFMSRSRQKMNNFEIEKETANNVESPIERRWSLASSSRTTSKKRKSQKDKNLSASSLVISPSNKKHQDLFIKNNECYDRLFMNADVNLSDENIHCDGIDSSRRLRRKSTRHHSILTDTSNHSTSKFNEVSNKNTNLKNEEYVKIPKSEYEEIKNRVSAIESRISQEFNNIIDQNPIETLPIDVASEVQNEYEKTLGEASIETINSADHLARRLSKELKIRRSAEHRVIRSPSARRIGNIRRRSQEKPINPRVRVNHTSTWEVSDKCENDTPTTPAEMQRDTNNIDTYCSDTINDRLSYLHQQLCTLISHTAEHTGSLLNNDDISLTTIQQPKSSSRVRRASSFHSGEHISESQYYNKRISELRKSNSQQNIIYTAGKNINYDTETPESGEKNLLWKDADAYLDFETPTKSMHTPKIIQTGRASIARIRTQNAGMVLAKAKLFDYNENKNCRETIREPSKIKNGPCHSKELKVPISTDIARKKKCRSPKNNSGRSRASQSPSGSTPTIYINYQPLDKCDTRRPSQTIHRETRHIARDFSSVSRENTSKLTNTENVNSSNLIQNSNLNVVYTSNGVNRVAEHNDEIFANATSTPHIKKPLSLKTPKSARSLARRPPVDTRRTPLKAVPSSLTTPKRHSPRTPLKSRQITKNIDIN